MTPLSPRSDFLSAEQLVRPGRAVARFEKQSFYPKSPGTERFLNDAAELCPPWVAERVRIDLEIRRNAGACVDYFRARSGELTADVSPIQCLDAIAPENRDHVVPRSVQRQDSRRGNMMPI